MNQRSYFYSISKDIQEQYIIAGPFLERKQVSDFAKYHKLGHEIKEFLTRDLDKVVELIKGGKNEG